MATLIKNKDILSGKRGGAFIKGSPIPDTVAALLPPALLSEVLAGVGVAERVEELRLRRNAAASLTVDGRNRMLRWVTDGEAMDRILVGLCEGSLYAHSESLKRGYVTVKGGVRVGVCGRAVTEEGRVRSLYDVSALNFRFPAPVFSCGAPIARLIRRLQRTAGVLIYSPPGEGKTTLLRGVILQLASGKDALRVAVIDTREELMAGIGERSLTVDCFTGYPKGEAMEIATRCMSPEVLVCDELGEEEIASVLGAQNAGVPLVATAHGLSLDGLLRRPGMEKLHKARVFGAYVGIERVPGALAFRYEITEWEEADERIRYGGKRAFADQRMASRKVDESGSGPSLGESGGDAGCSSVYACTG